MKNATLIHELTPNQILSLFEDLQTQIFDLKNSFQPKLPTEYLTRNEVKELLRCDLSTVHNWTVKGYLIPYGIGNRVYYKRSEIESALIPFGKNRG